MKQGENMKEPQTTAMSWYREEHYQDLKALCTDGDKLPATYAQWLGKAEFGRKRLESEGLNVVRVYLHPVEFPKWCKANAHEVNAAGRMAYASHIAAQGVFNQGDDGKIN
jgi:hypothetical protein